MNFIKRDKEKNILIRKVEKLPLNYAELIKRIDSGEYRVAIAELDGFSHYIENYTFDIKENIGILVSLIFNNKLRIQISFKEDINVEESKKIYDIIMNIIIKERKSADIWVNNDNTQLVSYLMNKFNLSRKQVYMSREMMYFKEPQSVDIAPLKTVPYTKEILMDTLNLLEASFVEIAQPNEFLNNVEYYDEKFSKLNKSRFTGFFLNNKLIGMYFHHDAEIEYIAVKPEYQSFGYGKIIIHHLIQAIKEDSDNIPYLYCVDENTKALRYYLREGFEVVAHAARLIVSK